MQPLPPIPEFSTRTSDADYGDPRGYVTPVLTIPLGCTGLEQRFPRHSQIQT